MTRHYEEVGAEVEVETIATGGRIGSGRWIIQEAADVSGATVDVVAPVQRRLLDYQKDPWHMIQWTAATPAVGVRTGLVVLDSAEDPDKLIAQGVPEDMIKLATERSQEIQAAYEMIKKSRG